MQSELPEMRESFQQGPINWHENFPMIQMRHHQAAQRDQENSPRQPSTPWLVFKNQSLITKLIILEL